ncbi:phage tail protein [Streptomyces sp. NPDC051452]|uniref:phage tail tube protein n=1 Tax=Streptomyces sp. NPDC051452 TaxID=3365654 RepID=UPI0037A39D50
MADDTQVRVGVEGAFYVAPVGTTAPTDPYSPWGAGWIDLGNVSEDGLTEALNENRQEFKAWGRTGAVRTQVTERASTFKVTFMETSAWTLALYYGIDLADMTSSGTGASQFLSFEEPQAPEPQYYALGMDVIDGDKPARIIVARAEVTDKGDRPYKSDTNQAFELTFSSLTAPNGGSAITRQFGLVALPS